MKLINLYEKFLCALVNFSHHPSGQQSFKLYRIKHEETSSTLSTNTSPATATTTTSQVSSTITPNTSCSSSSLSSMSTSSSLAHLAATIANSNDNKLKDSQKSSVDLIETSFSGNCLAATSSSRLNLTEFILTSIPSASLNSHIVSIMPISVTTLEDDNDLKYIAILSETGVISIIDPNKCCKLIDFPSILNEDKFCQMIYCYGIDKICALTQSGKINMISTRVSPLVNQAILDEISGSINLSELSLSKKLLVDASLDINVSFLMF